jgi:hypothetical protein
MFLEPHTLRSKLLAYVQKVALRDRVRKNRRDVRKAAREPEVSLVFKRPDVAKKQRLCRRRDEKRK